MTMMCSNCSVTDTVAWRKGMDGILLCNACGLYWRQQGRDRPLDLEQRGRKQKRPKPITEVKSFPIRNGKWKRAKGKTDVCIEPDFFEYPNIEEQLRGKSEMEYNGAKWCIGDYVAVKGVEHEEYYGIIYGFALEEEGPNRFWLKWLVPKSLPLSYPIQSQALMEVNPPIYTSESLDAILYAFDCLTVEESFGNQVEAVKEQSMNRQKSLKQLIIPDEQPEKKQDFKVPPVRSQTFPPMIMNPFSPNLPSAPPGYRWIPTKPPVNRMNMYPSMPPGYNSKILDITPPTTAIQSNVTSRAASPALRETETLY